MAAKIQWVIIDGTRWCSSEDSLLAWRVVGPKWFLQLVWASYRLGWNRLGVPINPLGHVVGARIEYADKKHMPPNDKRFTDGCPDATLTRIEMGGEVK